ncbi:MAG: RNA polymerase sigma factor [Oscillospiraceae bacterium]|nr:RNA polymerase sigma factor [Oscillospiraceae bacterium]
MSDFEAVYREYYPFICRYSYSLCRSRALAEDLAQETFLKAMKHIGSFRGECRLEVWLCQIAKNTWYTYQKKHARGLDELPYEPYTRDEDREAAMELHRALDALEEPTRSVVSLRALGELPFAQIAQLHGKTESWARVTFHRGKLKLKEMMEESP